MVNTREKAKSIFINFIIPFLFVVYATCKTRLGADYIDSMYSPGNFVFFKEMDGTWVVATFLASLFGYLITLLPFASTYVGLRFYTNLLIAGMAIGSYFFLKKRVPVYVAAIGEVLAIGLCWCPSTILYNYLTYFFMMLGVMALFVALTKERKAYFWIAGAMLGCNLFVRFPNICEVGFIAAVWVFGILKKKKFKDVLLETLYCMGGYFAAVLVLMGVIVILYGADSYVGMIQSLFGMTATNNSYSPVQMVRAILREARLGLTWVGILLVGAILGGIPWFFCKEKGKNLKKVWTELCILAAGVYCFTKQWFSFDYHTYQSFMNVAVVFILLAFAVFVIGIFSKKTALSEKLSYGLAILVMLITPLGSNNDLFPIYNNLFLLGPVTLFAFWAFAKRVTESSKELAFPIEALLLSVSVLLLIQSIGFGSTFVFRGHLYGEERDTVITQNKVLRGAVTNAERAERIEELSAFFEKNPAKELLLMGDLPGVSYFLNTPCAISSSWPDLGSYAYETFHEEMLSLQQRIDEEKAEMPMVIVNYGVYAVLTENEEEMAWYEENRDEGQRYLDELQTNEKYKDLEEFLTRNDYKMQLCNQRFVVFTSEGKKE